METCSSKLESFLKGELYNWRQLSSLNRQKDKKGRKECLRHMGHSEKATEGLEREDETQVIFER